MLKGYWLLREIDELASRQPSLGIPQADLDEVEEDVQEALEAFYNIKSEIIKDLSVAKRRASFSSVRNSFSGGAKPQLSEEKMSDILEETKESAKTK